MTTRPATILTPQEVGKLRRALPKSWTDAIGILRGKHLDPLRYQRQVRRGWEKRLRRQARLGRRA